MEKHLSRLLPVGIHLWMLLKKLYMLWKMQELIRQNVGYTPTTFTYPFGAVSKEALPVLKEMGFQATLICSSRINHITRDPDCLYGLGRFVRPSGVSSEQYFTKTVPLPE